MNLVTSVKKQHSDHQFYSNNMPYARIEWATLLVLLRGSLNVNILEMTNKFSIKSFVVDVY